MQVRPNAQADQFRFAGMDAAGQRSQNVAARMQRLQGRLHIRVEVIFAPGPKELLEAGRARRSLFPSAQVQERLPIGCAPHAPLVIAIVQSMRLHKTQGNRPDLGQAGPVQPIFLADLFIEHLRRRPDGEKRTVDVKEDASVGHLSDPWYRLIATGQKRSEK